MAINMGIDLEDLMDLQEARATVYKDDPSPANKRALLDITARVSEAVANIDATKMQEENCNVNCNS